MVIRRNQRAGLSAIRAGDQTGCKIGHADGDACVRPTTGLLPSNTELMGSPLSDYERGIDLTLSCLDMD
jgi:hypothetical protein